MVCEVCGRGPANGVDLFRTNEKGVKGIWRCRACPSAESFKNEVDGQWLTDALSGKKVETIH